jgi:hypothetical protein
MARAAEDRDFRDRVHNGDAEDARGEKQIPPSTPTGRWPALRVSIIRLRSSPQRGHASVAVEVRSAGSSGSLRSASTL